MLGCTSSAGKTLLVTALARWFRRQGVDVVPFKAQNMSNNARVVAGGEIGVAQWLQARAAGVEPEVTMNPVLVKPMADTRSQVVVLGLPRPELADVPWTERGAHLWPAMVKSLDTLQADHELVLIEGAGSPAEINLPDLVNNRVLAHADGRAVLVADIDRGGAFAHLFGTWSLVPDSTRERMVGFVLNKFRGDPSLLAPAPTFISDRTGMADIGVLPMLEHQLPDEEGATVRTRPPAGSPRVAVLKFPFGSNLDELNPLHHVARVDFVSLDQEVQGADLIVLPGSRAVASDLTWVRTRGLDRAIADSVAAGARVLGICGGAMMLGHAIDDPHGVEGAATGLGLLALKTEMQPDKLTERTTLTFGRLPPPWAPLDGIAAEGYEIRHGQVTADPSLATADARVWAKGRVLATTVHGLFEDPSVLEALTGSRPPSTLEDTFELLADAIDEHLDGGALWAMVRS